MKVRTGILREEAASILNRTVLPISLEIPYTDIEMYTDNYERGYKAVYNIGKLGIMEVAVLFCRNPLTPKNGGLQHLCVFANNRICTPACFIVKSPYCRAERKQ